MSNPNFSSAPARLGAPVVDTSRSPNARLAPTSVASVTLTDRFWAPRIEVNRTSTIPGQYRLLETTGRLENFRRVAGASDKPFEGIFFNDTDVYKWLEAASWSLASRPDIELDRLCDEVIALIASAQDTDGYLDTYFSLERKGERWSNLKDLHELYCAGHFIQAAIAHHRATGKSSALAIARRLADRVCSVFGDGPGQLRMTDGHEEVEMALVELYRTTGEQRYLDCARFLIDVRGRSTIGGGEYHQDHTPIREMNEITGHAVRAVYYTCGASDVALETGDAELTAALERLWTNMTERRMYISGGLGSRWEGEAFGADYELPSERAYTETCAAIGSVMWNWRMLLMTGESRFADLIEHTLFNAVLPGLSLDGAGYFYQNPLADSGRHRRQEWFGCACCPPNVARMLASLTGYFYATSPGAIWAHLYAESEAEISLDGHTVRLRQTTDYPWEGRVSFTVETEAPFRFALNLRVPAWADVAALHVNGEDAPTPSSGAYATIEREWRSGDVVEVAFPMIGRRAYAHPYINENTGRVAILRGPLLYCLEEADNPGIDLRMVGIDWESALEVEHAAALLGGVSVIRSEASIEAVDSEWSDKLYSCEPIIAVSRRLDRPVTAVPYYAWANRDAGSMRVWIREIASD